ncbi:hypothetical protein [Pseudomonas sp. URMO17WK12:I12]|uniref:hypothetical protein n=1 Tax=Pseudomonas sp. URMO17WK12:I12 TaxID=1259797 RepID=UPI0004807358|nr:hypothetical protein [Pseudomonas sp. URMO17WK12:I12]
MPGDFPDKNGCTLIVVDKKDFNRIVLSATAATFHWRSVPEYRAPAQVHLADLVEKLQLTAVDGSSPSHGTMHLDEEDASTPELHMHVVGDIDDQIFKEKILSLIESLAAQGHLTEDELAYIKRGIKAHNEW